LQKPPAGKAVEIALVNRPTSAPRQGFAMDVACKAASTSAPRIAIASTASASIEAAAPGPGADEHPSAFTSGLPLQPMRTNKELKVNGRRLWTKQTRMPRVDAASLIKGFGSRD
jgi:hypothetical protein